MGSSPSKKVIATDTAQKKHKTVKLPSFKIVLVGDSNCGKTSIFLRYIKNQFDFSYKPTRTANIGSAVRPISAINNIVVSVTLWDLPGKEVTDIRQTCYEGLHAAIVVVDLTDPKTLDSAAMWREDILMSLSESKGRQEEASSAAATHHPANEPSQRKPPMLLVGTKHDRLTSDLADRRESKRVLKALKDCAEQNHFIGSVCVSSKSGDSSVSSAINFLLKWLMDIKPEPEVAADRDQPDMGDVFLDTAHESSLEEAGFERTGMKAIDSILRESAVDVCIVKSLSSSWDKGKRRFIRVCGALPSPNRKGVYSLEQGILCIRDVLTRKNLSLQMVESGGFVVLGVTENGRLPPGITRALNTFHLDVSAVAKRILSYCSSTNEKFQEFREALQSALDNKSSSVRHKTRNARQYVYTATCILENSSRTAADLLDDVTATMNKLQAAMLW